MVTVLVVIIAANKRHIFFAQKGLNPQKWGKKGFVMSKKTNTSKTPKNRTSRKIPSQNVERIPTRDELLRLAKNIMGRTKVLTPEMVLKSAEHELVKLWKTMANKTAAQELSVVMKRITIALDPVNETVAPMRTIYSMVVQSEPTEIALAEQQVGPVEESLTADTDVGSLPSAEVSKPELVELPLTKEQLQVQQHSLRIGLRTDFVDGLQVTKDTGFTLSIDIVKNEIKISWVDKKRLPYPKTNVMPPDEVFENKYKCLVLVILLSKKITYIRELLLTSQTLGESVEYLEYLEVSAKELQFLIHDVAKINEMHGTPYGYKFSSFTDLTREVHQDILNGAHGYEIYTQYMFVMSAKKFEEKKIVDVSRLIEEDERKETHQIIIGELKLMLQNGGFDEKKAKKRATRLAAENGYEGNPAEWVAKYAIKKMCEHFANGKTVTLTSSSAYQSALMYAKSVGWDEEYLLLEYEKVAAAEATKIQDKELEAHGARV